MTLVVCPYRIVCVIDSSYPGGIVSQNGHSLKVRHFQVGGHVHCHFQHWWSSGLALGHGNSNCAAPLQPLAVGQDETEL